MITFKSLKKAFGKALVVTCLALPVMQLLVLNPFEQVADFSISDFYIRTANRIRPTTLFNDVVVISVDNLSRLEIANIAERADFLGAKVVALDVFMNWSTDYDKEVVSALSMCDNLILPSSLTESYVSPVFSEIEGAKYGYVNLECSWDGAKIRRFDTRTGDSRSFAAAACDCNDIKSGIIRYDSKDFEIISPEELCAELVRNKIVFLGNLNDFSDCHPTPIGVLPGVMIHAFIARTIIDNNSPHVRSNVVGLLFSMFFTVFITTLLLLFFNGVPFQNNLATFLVQIVFSFVLYLVGAILFCSFDYYADISIIILMIATIPLVYESLVLVKGAYLKIRSKVIIKRKK